MSPAEQDPEPPHVPGLRLGLPASGPGSVASWGRRIAALLVDWLLASVVVLLLRGLTAWTPGSGQELLPVAAWVVIVTVSTGITGASPGQHLLGLRVIRLDWQRVGLWTALVRTLLIALVIPPVVSDRDRRGLHDLTVDTIVVNGPRQSAAAPRR
jgi:uncharacterized RDD family membrane protein YckC